MNFGLKLPERLYHVMFGHSPEVSYAHIMHSQMHMVAGGMHGTGSCACFMWFILSAFVIHALLDSLFSKPNTFIHPL